VHAEALRHEEGSGILQIDTIVLRRSTLVVHKSNKRRDLARRPNHANTRETSAFAPSVTAGVTDSADPNAAFGYGTFPKSINYAGAITGHYADVHNVIHGFVRSPSGQFTTFEAPGASSVAASGYGTFPESINDAGAITGRYADANGLYHGFLRSPGRSR
jgi:hypothetical protein